MSQTSDRAFRQLVDADMTFGDLEDETGTKKELSNATFISFLVSPDRKVRKAAFEQYYETYIAHENTLAATLAGSIHRDVYYARARGYDSALHSALFSDNLPASVYDQLIESVRNYLPALHRYYEVRRRKMKLRKIHHYDTYVPILSDLETKHTWKQATKTIIDSLQPLGDDYCKVLEQGLNGRWCDRYPNRGKQSGAFSSGSYDGDPYIMMNYQPTVLNDVFTLAHEARHSRAARRAPRGSRRDARRACDACATRLRQPAVPLPIREYRAIKFCDSRWRPACCSRRLSSDSRGRRTRWRDRARATSPSRGAALMRLRRASAWTAAALKLRAANSLVRSHRPWSCRTRSSTASSGGTARRVGAHQRRSSPMCPNILACSLPSHR